MLTWVKGDKCLYCVNFEESKLLKPCIALVAKMNAFHQWQNVVFKY